MEIDKLFGNETEAKTLLFLARYEEATVGEISLAFDIPKSQIYLQLKKMENAGIVASRQLGNLRIYFFNPRLSIKKELRALLEKYIETNMPMETNKAFYLVRRRPRARGKPLGGDYER